MEVMVEVRGKIHPFFGFRDDLGAGEKVADVTVFAQYGRLGTYWSLTARQELSGSLSNFLCKCGFG
jgi:hypothetical protein